LDKNAQVKLDNNLKVSLLLVLDVFDVCVSHGNTCVIVLNPHLITTI